ncbi:extensin family protein [Qipengyuania sp. 6B39]|uniref:extensin-like domain-containing protein n=1 Tax=Qipengyuania proteolytica TaxID=2867239 RepID=UPI001C894EB6|nr:extensin family protein [Qipengyuania proteolytica]MBX7495948.1 extensin family protein [Qipengyuania proteolytica]
MRTRISRRIGRFTWDRRIVILLVLAGLLLAGRSWLQEHPGHNPWAPLDLRDPPGWATEAKLLALRSDTQLCRATLARSRIAFEALEPVGEGACLRADRTRLANLPLSPDTPATTCPAAVATYLWERDVLEPAAQEIFGTRIASVQHLGAYSCRRLYGRDEGPWSEHATANAIDIAGFTLFDGTRISVLRDWDGEDDEARFLRMVRDGACDSFATVLSPDYNAAHADHLHLDMSERWRSVCR